MRLVSVHLLRTTSRWIKHWSKDLPNTEKSSINTSMFFSITSEKMECIHLWKVVDALHSPKGILL